MYRCEGEFVSGMPRLTSRWVTSTVIASHRGQWSAAEIEALTRTTPRRWVRSASLRGRLRTVEQRREILAQFVEVLSNLVETLFDSVEAREDGTVVDI